MRLPTEKELTDIIKSKGGQPLLYEDQWAPTRDTDGKRNYICVGEYLPSEHYLGMSLTKRYGWPVWADQTGLEKER